MNTIIGAVIASLIALVTGAMALLQGEGVMQVSDISQVQWLILGGGALITFLKDYQAIATRSMINRVTKTNDGGGSVS